MRSPWRAILRLRVLMRIWIGSKAKGLAMNGDKERGETDGDEVELDNSGAKEFRAMRYSKFEICPEIH